MYAKIEMVLVKLVCGHKNGRKFNVCYIELIYMKFKYFFWNENEKKQQHIDRYTGKDFIFKMIGNTHCAIACEIDREIGTKMISYGVARCNVVNKDSIPFVLG